MKPFEFRGECDLTSEFECFRVNQMFYLFEHISKTHHECTFFSSKMVIIQGQIVFLLQTFIIITSCARKVPSKAFGTVVNDLLHP